MVTNDRAKLFCVQIIYYSLKQNSRKSTACIMNIFSVFNLIIMLPFPTVIKMCDFLIFCTLIMWYLRMEAVIFIIIIITITTNILYLNTLTIKGKPCLSSFSNLSYLLHLINISINEILTDMSLCRHSSILWSQSVIKLSAIGLFLFFSMLYSL